MWALVVAQFNTVVNPLLYGVFSENFRACFVKLWRREAAHNNNNNNNNPGSGERGSGGNVTGTNHRANPAKSLEVLQSRLSGKPSGGRSSNGCSSNKMNSCSIASIIEMPASEKL